MLYIQHPARFDELGGIRVLFTLLKHTDEGVRLYAVKILGQFPIIEVIEEATM